MAPTYMDGLHTMAWMSLVGLIALACVLVVFGCLLTIDHFPASRIATFLYTPKLRLRIVKKPAVVVDFESRRPLLDSAARSAVPVIWTGGGR